jgi:hypothetical protein
MLVLLKKFELSSVASMLQENTFHHQKLELLMIYMKIPVANTFLRKGLNKKHANKPNRPTLHIPSCVVGGD